MAENEQKIYSKHLFTDKLLEGLTLVAVSAIFMGFLGVGAYLIMNGKTITGLIVIVCETLAAIAAITTKKKKYRASMQ